MKNTNKIGSSLNPLGLENCYVAGGAVLSYATRQPISDYDVYPKTKEAAIDAIAACVDDGYIVNITEKAVTIKVNSVTNVNDERAIFQIMIFDTFDNPENIFEFFDFTVCMGAYDCDTGELHTHEDFYPDIASKTLRYNPNTKYPLNSLLRLTKYRAKGYYISKPEHTKMILSIMLADRPTSWEDLESQIGGTYGKEVFIEASERELEFTIENAINLLSEIDSFHVEESDDFSHIKEADVDFVFNENIKFIDGQNIAVIDGIPYDVCPSIIDAREKIFGEETEFYEGKLRGYKALLNEDGVLKPGVRTINNNGITYRLGVRTEWDKHPNLHVSDTPSKKSVIFTNRDKVEVWEVEYNIEDIIKVTPYEIRVKGLIPIRKVEEDTPEPSGLF